MSEVRPVGDAGHGVTSEIAMRASASHPARGCRVAPGYDDSMLARLPRDAVAGAAGCGDPVGRCELQAGDVVVDLGSGTGIDLILAARRVGPSGHVIGVDGLPEMVAAARATVDLCGVGNVEVRRARIEALPIPPSSVDWVVANCAINRSKEKPQVFSEIARVLKAGARMGIADVFTHGLPVGRDAELALEASCVAQATSESEYIVALARAGLVDFTVGGRYVYDQSELAAMVAGVTPRSAPGHQASDLAAALVGGVWRAYVSARKPATKREPPDLLIEVNGGQCIVGIQKGATRHGRFS